MADSELCDACGLGKLHEVKQLEEIDNGKSAYMKSSICDTCGSELTNAKQMLLNKLSILKNAKRNP